MYYFSLTSIWPMYSSVLVVVKLLMCYQNYVTCAVWRGPNRTFKYKRDLTESTVLSTVK